MKALALKGLACAGILAAVGMSGSASAQQTLKFAMPGAPHDVHYEQVLIPWAKKVEEDSKGALKIEFYVGPRLANFGNLTSRILDGVVDLGFGLEGPSGEPFPRSDVVQLPFITGDPAEVAPALWSMFESGLIAEEYKRWKVLALFSFPGTQIHSKIPVMSKDDLKGHKLAATSKVLADVLTGLGAAPVSMGPPDQYQAISNGVIEGTLMPWTGVDDFKIYEVTKHHLVTNLGVPTAYVFMSNAVYDKLPAEAKKAIDDNSGMSLSRALGNNTSQHGRDSAGKVGALAGQQIEELSAEQRAEWEKILQPITDNWVKATPDGAKILATYKDLVAKYRAENAKK